MRYAILIGINTYRDDPLQGCVYDVQEIKNYLEIASESTSIDILTTAETSTSDSLSEEAHRSLPTYENVISAIERVILLGNRGDCVYIHYSGHGTRSTPSSEFSNKSTGDLALVLLSGREDNEVRYLYGPRLAHSLRAMVEKGLIVTLVLDCCFSASVYRRGNHIRFLPYDSNVALMFPPGPQDDVGIEVSDPVDRDTSMLPNWLINPDGCAILVACGPHEKAIEPKFDGRRRGALSYWLLAALKQCDGLEQAHKDIYDHIRVFFRKYKLTQNPVLYGNKDQGFFGHASLGSTPTVPIIARRDGRLELQAGLAHGVCEGDRFALCPLGSVRSQTGLPGNPILSKVVRAGSLVSDLERLEESSLEPKTGWAASCLTRASLAEFPIRLDPSLPRRHEWLKGLRERSLKTQVTMDEDVSFIVKPNSKGEYEIMNGQEERIVNAPVLLRTVTNDNKFYGIMEHLAKYNMVKELSNPMCSIPFRASFKAQITTCSGERFEPGHVIEMKQDEKSKYTFELVVENQGRRELYVYVYNMGPYKQIQNILRGTYEVIPSPYFGSTYTPRFRRKLKTAIPREMIDKGHLQCEDIIKVFLTSQPTSFDLLELPKIGESLKGDSSRAGRHDADPSEDWAALNFVIRTSLGPVGRLG
ncbi:putative caspase [Nemania abortiva]|nr:putative caspase [Nemania abortiva]